MREFLEKNWAADQSEDDSVLLDFDVSFCVGYCDKLEVKDSAGATSSVLSEPSLCGKICQAILPCRGGQLILSATDSAGEPMFDLRSPPAWVCACKCSCTLQCSCSGCCGSEHTVAMNIT